jgi:hypothetical protein
VWVERRPPGGRGPGRHPRRSDGPAMRTQERSRYSRSDTISHVIRCWLLCGKLAIFSPL